MFVAALGAMLWWSAGPHPAVARAAGCTASPVTDPLSVTVTPNTDVRAWQKLRVEFSGSISDGHCAGDSFSVQVPPQLHPADGSTYELRAPDGSVVARMTVHGQSITVTLTDYVETHQGVTLSGWLQATIDNSTAPGDTVELSWDVNGKVSTTPVQMGSCPDCSTTPPTKPAKWGSDNGDGTLTVVIQTATTKSDNEQVFFSDHLTSPGQRFECPVTVRTMQFTKVGAWGDPTDLGPGPQVSLTECSDVSASGTMTVAKAGTVVRIYLSVRITDSTQPSWSDVATVTQAGQRADAQTTVASYTGGGVGEGSTAPATPSPTPSTSSPSTPSAAPTTTDRASSSDGSSADASQTDRSRGTLAETGSHSGGLTLLALAALLLGSGILVLGARPTRQH